MDECHRDVILLVSSILSKVFQCHTLVSFYVLNNLLVVVVRLAAGKVKPGEGVTLQAEENRMDALQNVKHSQALFPEWTARRTAAAPVGHHMEVYRRLGTIVHTPHHAHCHLHDILAVYRK